MSLHSRNLDDTTRNRDKIPKWRKAVEALAEKKWIQYIGAAIVFLVIIYFLSLKR